MHGLITLVTDNHVDNYLKENLAINKGYTWISSNAWFDYIGHW